jgi:hypothetical protein
MIKGWDESNCVFALCPNWLTNGGRVESFNTGSALPYQGPAGPGNITATLQGTLSGYGFDKPTGALKFDGAGDYIQTNNSMVVKPGCAIEFWANASAAATNRAVCAAYINSSNYVLVRFRSTSGVELIISKAGTVYQAVNTTVGILSAGLHHVVAKIGDSAPYKLTLYVDGAEITYTTVQNWTGETWDLGVTQKVGGYDGAGHWFDSSVYFIAIYTSITPARISANYALGPSMAGIKAKQSGENAVVFSGLPQNTGLHIGTGLQM